MRAYPHAPVIIYHGARLQVFNALYGWLAKALTEWENHRTQTEYLYYTRRMSRPLNIMHD